MEFNRTLIALVSKKSYPEKFIDFTSISLCNVIYNIGSKVMVSRMKSLMDKLITPIQNVFIPVRLIFDNVYSCI